MKKFRFIVASYLIVSLITSLILPSLLWAELRIASIEIDHSDADLIRKVLPIQEGDPYDPKRVDQAISYLKKWGRFESVMITPTISGNSVALRVNVLDGAIVSGIDIYGTYPYLSVRIRRIITVHSGDLYDEAAAKSQVEKIEAFYHRHGFEDATVDFTPKFNEKNKTIDLVYHIHRGGRYRIGKITIEGNTVFPFGYFNSKINPLLLYEPSRLRKSLEKIREGYRDHGYLGARVRLKDLGKDEENRLVNPTIEIHQGKHVSVHFEGNKLVSDRTFKKNISLFTEGGYDEYEVESSAKSMIDYYRRRGFQEAMVDYQVTKPTENEVDIVFLIHEGPQTRVKSIEIQGNDQIPDKKITKNFLTKENSLLERGYYQERTVIRDFANLPTILKSQGALEGKGVDHKTNLNEFRDKAFVTFQVEEGPVTRVAEIRFEGNQNIASKKLQKRLKLKEGNPFNPEAPAIDSESIKIYYANNGFPYVTVKPEVEHTETEAHITYIIDEGIETKIGEVLVVGNERTNPKAVLRGMRLRPGKPFSYKKILESETALRRSGSFRSVNIQTIGLTEKEPVVHLVVQLEEYRKILLDIGATYDTDNSFTGEINLAQVNLWNTIRRANLKLIGGRDIQKGEILLRDPFFFSSPLEASITGFAQRLLNPGFDANEVGGSLNFLREFTPQTSFLGRYEITRTFFFNVTDTAEASEEDHTTSRFSFSFNYDKRDSFADPHRGYVAFTGFDVSNQLIASNFDAIQPKGYFAYYLPIGRRITWINFARMEGIKVFGADVLPRDERLFLGGDYTVRGFDQDSIGPIDADGDPEGGQLLLAATSEIQVRLFGNFKFAGFFDNGSITDTFGEVSLDSFRHSAGFGLRYVTPVGPLRLDYGFKLDRKTNIINGVPEKESLSRLHFAFGYSF